MNSTYPQIDVLEMHTGGEAVRIVLSGYPPIPGDSILAKRRYAQQHLDHLRRFLMFEPRGHYDMYGVLPVQPSLPEADLAVLFIHNEGYSTMCGHAVIALGRYAVDYGLVEKVEPLTRVNIECPCGLVSAYVEVKGGQSGKVYFDSVPAFLLAADVEVQVPGYGAITVDVAYGGAFYALADAMSLGVDIYNSPVRHLVDAATALTGAVRNAVTLAHPEHADLAFLYGSILTDGRNHPEDGVSHNICVFADAEVDRSPTGSGVTARTAARVARGQIMLGETAEFESITGARFSAEAIRQFEYGEGTGIGTGQAVQVRVAGRAHYAGKASFWLEEGDRIGQGFLLR
ncbi:proline racemase family protein [Pokkaliibacter sp. MBI-7]|uniref:proline racemase family protein n=1 Tax=Pokkaliibacter sp. MBI-7 TaxID=3040600 RepID=UPI002448814B|nr:proline racemase family protein [Pokkaliibacter sp. MBI-7]MDH2433810.1 proline racemase family protein [Pokkaliibacter sp. MBI-7]